MTAYPSSVIPASYNALSSAKTVASNFVDSRPQLHMSQVDSLSLAPPMTILASRVLSEEAVGMGTSWIRPDEEEEEEERHIGHLKTLDELNGKFREHLKVTTQLGEDFYNRMLKERDDDRQKKEVAEKKFLKLKTLSDQMAETIKKLNEEKDFLIDQQKGIQEFSYNTAGKISELHELQKEKKELLKKVEQLERSLQNEIAMRRKAEENVHKLKKIINPMSEMDRRGQITIPGGTTHEGVAGAFGSIYTDRNFLKPLQIYNTTERGVFLTTLFESAYKLCAKHIIEVTSNELNKVHTAPDIIYSSGENYDKELSIMRSRLDAYAYLVSISGAKEKGTPPIVVEKMLDETIIKERLTNGNKAEASQIVHKIVENCWKMVHLTPPMTLGLQPSCDDEFFDKKLLRDQPEQLDFEDQLKLPNRKLQLLCPILFFSPHTGTYKRKGTVRIINQAESDNQRKDDAEHSSKTASENAVLPDLKSLQKNQRKDEHSSKTASENAVLPENQRKDEHSSKTESAVLRLDSKSLSENQRKDDAEHSSKTKKQRKDDVEHSSKTGATSMNTTSKNRYGKDKHKKLPNSKSQQVVNKPQRETQDSLQLKLDHKTHSSINNNSAPPDCICSQEMDRAWYKSTEI